MATNKPKTAKQRGVGKPFTKGVTGNPSGRPRVTQEELDLRMAARLKAPEALQTILELMENSQNDKVRLSAAETILDRGYGKATQTVEMNVRRSANELSDAELHAIASGARDSLAAIGEEKLNSVH